MSKKINLILKEVLKKIEPSKEDLDFINKSLNEFKQKIISKIKQSKINAEIFVGGSFAKQTMIKKDKYDADFFIRFDKKYPDAELSNLTAKLLKNFKNVSLIHGSRDYFRIKLAENFYIELVPVKKINNPEQAENITDLSYSHVLYIKNKIKSQKILNDIKLAKAFCYANQCYGAESYINGFSGYSLELLVYYYRSFEKFIREISKIKNKEVIDVGKCYKNKSQILMDINSSKLQSPIILVDPTYKQRNALAALSEETLRKFQKACKEFLKNPLMKHFENSTTDLKKIKSSAEKNMNQFILLEAETKKQAGDIAGSKLFKFYNHFTEEIKKLFEIKNLGFEYFQKQIARYFFVVKPKKEIVLHGPFVDDEKHVKEFKKQHKKIFIKSKRLFAKEIPPQNLVKFIKFWKDKNSKKIKDMDISDLKIRD